MDSLEIINEIQFDLGDLKKRCRYYLKVWDQFCFRKSEKYF